MAQRINSVWADVVEEQPPIDPRSTSTHVVVFLLAFLIPFRADIFGFPASTLAALGLIAVGFLRSATLGSAPSLLYPLVSAVPIWLAVSAVLNDSLDIRRLGTATAWAGLIYVLGTGRIHAPSLARGALLGCLVGLVTAVSGLAPSAGYGGRLTGWMADPNGVAMMVLSLGLASAAWASARTKWTVASLLLIVVMVVYSESRTGLFAMALAACWVIWLRKWHVAGALVVAAVASYTFENLPDRIKYWGPFADRHGSDMLRERILSSAQAIVEQRPLIGSGPGSARAVLDGQEFFFHDSFLSARAEGGWVLLGIISAVLGFAFLALTKAERTWRTGLAQSALIAHVLTASNIGEALLTPAAAGMIGLSVAWSFHQRELGIRSST